MIRLRIHIAFLLFGIFFFPILFQSIHIACHQYNNYKSEHHFCHDKVHDKVTNAKGEKELEKENTCLLCEYQFSINDLPDVFFFSSVIPAFSCVSNEIAENHQYKQVYTVKTPRAPPVFFLIKFFSNF